MTDTPLLQLQPAVPEALIQSDADALCFFVSGVEVFRLTPVGMEYKGQIVEDAGVAYREITEFFSAVKEAKNYQPLEKENLDDLERNCAHLTNLSIGLSGDITKGFLAWIEDQDDDYFKIHMDLCTDDAGAVCRHAAEKLRLLADAFDALATMDGPCTFNAHEAAMAIAAELRGQEDSND